MIVRPQRPVHVSNESNEGPHFGDRCKDRGTNVRSRQAGPLRIGAAFRKISSHLQNELTEADWTTKRKIIRALVQRIEIGQKKVAVVLLPANRRQWACARPNYGDIVTGVNTPVLGINGGLGSFKQAAFQPN
jgi:hypothetical protein